jgi:hypothetical protein
MIDALTAAAFEDMPESLLPVFDDVGALLDAPLVGAFDDHLEHIASVVKLRRDQIADVTELMTRSRFAEGDRVRFVKAARPVTSAATPRTSREGDGTPRRLARRTDGTLHGLALLFALME